MPLSEWAPHAGPLASAFIPGANAKLSRAMRRDAPNRVGSNYS